MLTRMIETDRQTRERRAAVPTVKKEEGWWETVKVIIEALLIALVVRTVPVPAFQHSVRFAGSDAARWRLFVRLQICLRLFAFFAAELPRP